jgi:hypothetical protein
LKYPEIVDGKIVKPTNRELVKLYLADSSHQFITEQDRVQGRRCRQDLRNSATIAALRNRATEWTLLSAQMATLETVTTDYEVSVITAMPKSHDQNLARETVDGQLAYCNADPVGRVNEMITVEGEVVRSNYSANWNTFYVTVITDSNYQVFFAYRERLEPGLQIKLRGRVKRHADRATQLSRVKILQQEAV